MALLAPLLLLVRLCTSFSSSPIAMAAKPGAGATLIATSPIRAGQVLVDEPPLISLAHSRDNEAAGGNSGTWFAPSDSYVLNLIETQLERLSDDDYKAYYQLFGYCGGVDRASNALDIFKTNAYPLERHSKVDYQQIISRGSSNRTSSLAAAGGVEGQPRRRSRAGVYKTISRINHSCQPNVCYSFDGSSGRGRVIATRDIAQGAELLNAYTSLFASASERQQYLATNFGFACDCYACSPSPGPGGDVYRVQTPADIARRLQSDERRRELGRLKEQVEQAVGLLQSGGAAAMSAIDAANHRRMQLLSEEGIATPDLLLEVLQSQLGAAVLVGGGEGGEGLLRLCSQAYALGVLCRGVHAPESLALRRLCNELRFCDDLSV